MQFNRQTSIFLVLGILAVFFIGGGLLVRTNAPVQPSEKPIPVDTPDISSGEASAFVMNDFHRSETKDGHTMWEIHGSRGQYMPSQNLAKIDNADLVLSRKADEHVHLTAKRAILHLTGTQLTKAELFDDIVVVYNEKTTLKTDQATYDKTNNSISAPGVVNIESETMTITGTELVADLETHEFRLLSKVKTELKPRKPGIKEKK